MKAYLRVENFAKKYGCEEVQVHNRKRGGNAGSRNEEGDDSSCVELHRQCNSRGLWNQRNLSTFYGESLRLCDVIHMPDDTCEPAIPYYVEAVLVSLS